MTPQSNKKQPKPSVPGRSMSSGADTPKIVSNGLPRSADLNSSHTVSTPLSGSASAGAMQAATMNRLSALPAGTTPVNRKSMSVVPHTAEVPQPALVSVTHASSAETPALSHSAKVI